MANPIHVPSEQWLAGSYSLCKSSWSPSLDSEKTTLTHLGSGCRLFSVWSGVWRSSLHPDLAPSLLWDPGVLPSASSSALPRLGPHILCCGVPLLLTMATPLFSIVSCSPSLLVSFTKQVWAARSPPRNLGSGRTSSPHLGLSCWSLISMFYFMELCTV